MKFAVYSDIHLEFGEPEPIDTSMVDLVVFAGDIHNGKRAIQWMTDTIKDKQVIYVLGNHEYYRSVYPKLIQEIKSEAPNYIHILENETFETQDTIFHGCTLWTDFELLGKPNIAGYQCQQVMNDFKLIRRLPNYSKLRSIDAAVIHKKSLNWLQKSLMESTKKNVVITHHAPSIKSVPLGLRDEITTSSYASNLEAFIVQHNISIWVHGHLHDSSDYTVGNCRIVCNPMGYVGSRNPLFNPAIVVES